MRFNTPASPRALSFIISIYTIFSTLFLPHLPLTPQDVDAIILTTCDLITSHPRSPFLLHFLFTLLRFLRDHGYNYNTRLDQVALSSLTVLLQNSPHFQSYVQSAPTELSTVFDTRWMFERGLVSDVEYTRLLFTLVEFQFSVENCGWHEE